MSDGKPCIPLAHDGAPTPAFEDQMLDAPKPPELQGVTQQHDDGITVVQQFRLVEPNAQEGIDALKKNLTGDELLLAVRCPCGFMIGLSVPREAYTRADAAALATKALKQFIPMLAQHLDKDLTEHVCPLREIAQPKEG